MTDADQHADSLSIIAATNLEALMIQRTAIERMETKGAILLGFTATASQLVLFADDLISGWRIASLAALALSFALGLVVVAPFGYADVLVPSTFYARYKSKAPGDVKRVLAATRAVAYEKNRKVARRKARAWWRTLALLVVGIALAGVASLGG